MKKLLKKILTFILVVAVTFLYVPACSFLPSSEGATYYFDSNASSDGNGTEAKPYNNLSKISSIKRLKGGDKICLKCGSTFFGSFVIDGLCGEEDNPIVITSYGEGNLPKIDGNGLEGTGVVYIKNCSYLTVENLEVYNSVSTEGDRRGVYICTYNPNVVDEPVANEDASSSDSSSESESSSSSEPVSKKDIITYHDITVQNLVIHDIRGYIDAVNNGLTMYAKKTGGILVKTTESGTIDGLNILNNKIYTCDNVGISSLHYGKYNVYQEEFLNYAIKNANVSYNEIYDIGKNAIFMRGIYDSVISHNVCHDTATRCYAGNTIVTCRVYKVTIEYNEGYRNMAIKNPLPTSTKNLQDGCMLDADLQSRETIWQYNYSHDNSFGLFLNCTGANRDDTNSQDEVIVRYNISVADYGNKGVLFINYYAKSFEIYNNTIIATDQTQCIFYDDNEKVRTYHLYNNIIYDATSAGGTASTVASYYSTKATLNNNLMYSQNVPIINANTFFDKGDTYSEDPEFLCSDFGDVDTFDHYSTETPSGCQYRTGFEKGLMFAKLASSSYCFDIDYASTVAGVTKDIAGNPYQPSLGCYSVGY